MSTAYIFTAEDLEEVECLTVVDLLRRGGVDCSMVSLTEDLEIRGSHGIRMMADLIYGEADMEEADALILPGGMPGTLHLAEDRRLAEDLVKAKSSGKLVCAICAAPRVLGGLGLLQGEKATCHPGHEEFLTGAELTENEVLRAEGSERQSPLRWRFLKSSGAVKRQKKCGKQLFSIDTCAILFN